MMNHTCHKTAKNIPSRHSLILAFHYTHTQNHIRMLSCPCLDPPRHASPRLATITAAIVVHICCHKICISSNYLLVPRPHCSAPPPASAPASVSAPANRLLNCNCRVRFAGTLRHTIKYATNKHGQKQRRRPTRNSELQPEILATCHKISQLRLG